MSGPAAALLAGPALALDDFPVACAWSSDSRYVLVAGGEGQLLRVTRAAGEAQLLGTHEPGLLSVSWQGGGNKVVTAGQDGSIRSWNGVIAAGAATAGAGQVLHRGMAWPLALSWSPQGKALAFAAGRDVVVLDADGKLLHRYANHSSAITQLAWRNASELLAAGAGSGFVLRLPPQSATTEFTLEGAPLTLAVSPDGRIVAAGTQDGTVSFRYLANQKKSRMSGYDGKVTQTTWSANSRFLATTASGANVIIVWDFGGKGPEGSEPLQLSAHTDRIESLAFQPRGNLLASGGRDWLLALWRPTPGKAAAAQASAQQALDLQLLDAPIAVLSWSPDGNCLAVAQANGRLRLYELHA